MKERDNENKIKAYKKGTCHETMQSEMSYGKGKKKGSKCGCKHGGTQTLMAKRGL